MDKKQSNPFPPISTLPYPGCKPPSRRKIDGTIDREFLELANAVKDINSRLTRMERDVEEIKLKLGIFI